MQNRLRRVLAQLQVVLPRSRSSNVEYVDRENPLHLLSALHECFKFIGLKLYSFVILQHMVRDALASWGALSLSRVAHVLRNRSVPASLPMLGSAHMRRIRVREAGSYTYLDPQTTSLLFYYEYLRYNSE